MSILRLKDVLGNWIPIPTIKGDQGPKGDKGDKGDTGIGLQVKGTYATLAALQAAVTDPAIGDMYNVGSAAPFNIYMWNGNAWENQGQLQGLKGDTGDTGPQGVKGETGEGVVSGGSTGQALRKASSTDYDTEWGDIAVDKTATLSASGWSASAPYTQTVNVTGITAAMTPIADIVLSATQATAETELEDWGKVSKIVTGAGSITVTCFKEKPTVALNIIMKVVG